MSPEERLKFETEDRRRIYGYVERHGVVDPDEVAEHVRTDLDELGAELAELDHLEERDGRVRMALDTGEEEVVSTPEFEVTVRPAREEDLAGIVGAIRQVAGEQQYIEAESVAELLDREEVVHRFNEVESRVFFVATVAGDVVGWAHLRSPEIEKLGHTAELTVGVIEGYRGQGIGSTLVARGLDRASEHGYEKVYQSLPATNQEAVRFLEDHGWVTGAIREYHYKIDDRYVAEQMMAILL